MLRSTLSVVCTTLIAVGLAFSLASVSAQDAAQKSKKADDKKKNEAKDKEKAKKKGKQAQKKDVEEALKLLDQATELKLNAKQLPDLIRVAALCEEAIKKGLSGEDKSFAIELHSASLFKRAEQIGNQIINEMPPPERWRLFRQVALTDLERILKLNDKMGPAHLMAAQLHAMPGGDKKKGLKSADKAVALLKDEKQKLSEALAARGRLQTKPEKQFEDLNQALALNPKNRRAREARAFLNLARGKNKEASSDFNQLMRENPDDLRYQLALVEALSSQKRYAEARKIVDSILKRNPESTLALSMRARIFVFEEKIPEAVADLTKILEIDPLDPESLLLRGRLLYEQKKYEAALEDVENLIRVADDMPQGYYLRSIIYEKQKKYADAIVDAKRLVKMEPDNVQWQLQLGELHFRNKQPKLAEDLYDKYLKEHKKGEDRWLAFYARADLNLNLGEHKKAVADYEEALKIKADSHGILNNMAWVLATSPEEKVRNGKRAIELATKACKITDYKRPHILSTLAAGYAEIGDFKTAIKWSQKAVDLEKETATKKLLQKELDSYLKKKPWRERKTLADLDKEEAEAQENETKSSTAGN